MHAHTAWLIIIAAMLFMAGVQLNRIEKQNERLHGLMREIAEKLGPKT